MNSVTTLQRHAIAGIHGKDWYSEAIPLLQVRAENFNVGLEEYNAVLAITSPRVRVHRNVKFTEDFFRQGMPALRRHLPGVRAAMAHYLDTGEIRGPKTSAFRRALSGDHDAIVLDTWMARALNVNQSKLSTKRVICEAERRIRRVAKNLSITPAECQAAIWHGVYNGNAPSLIEILKEV